MERFKTIDTMEDYEFIQELDKRYMENNPYVLDEHDCVHISENLHLIHSAVGIEDHMIRSFNEEDTLGHRRLCLEYEPQRQDLKSFADEFPRELELVE